MLLLKIRKYYAYSSIRKEKYLNKRSYNNLQTEIFNEYF